ERGFRIGQVFDIVREFSKLRSTPIILFGYYNPVLRMGEDEFVARAHDAGAAGTLLVDLSFEESTGIRSALSERQMHFIPLIAPTTAPVRARTIAESATGFIYYVSMTGVTGDAIRGLDAIRTRVEELRTFSETPIAVGFGVRTGEDVAQVARFADGVVVGSELVRRLHAADGEGLPEVGRRFVASLREHTSKS
ncbi:MAG: tryptophan synthase subunit alpha, partial [Myxococcales bacterium]|nr:tryptophan synthase subunit alpha [Myxococcales bacterium]